IGSWEHDINIHEVRWSEELYHILRLSPKRYKPDEQSLLRLVAEEDRENVRKAVKTAISRGECCTIECHVALHNGSLRFVRAEVRVECNHYGKPKRLSGTVQDITHIKRAEEALKESEARYRRLVENTDTGFVVVDEAAHVVEANAPYANLVGYRRREDLVGRSVYDWTPPDSVEEKKRVILHCMKTGYLRDFETVFQRPNGEVLNVLVNATMQKTPEGNRLTAFCRNITERKHIEEELAEERRNLEHTVEMRTRDLSESLLKLKDTNLRLKEANLAKARFLSSMSHELRTPLNGILGFTDLLNRQYFGSLNEKQLNYVGQIDSSGKHLLALINDLLDMAKIDAGAMELERGDVSIEDFINATVAMMSSQFKKKNIKLKTLIDPALPIISGDVRKCKQIMFNLFSNAIKYTHKGGQVEVRAAKINLVQAKIEVRDTGIGIAEHELDNIFSEFHQADHVRDEQLGGTGIGLALTRRLVELHGGEIGVDSEPGSGSNFWFTLPIRKRPLQKTKSQKKDSTKAASLETTAMLTGCNILVVEDNEANLSMILDTLSMQDHKVTVARNGREAIEQSQQHKPELILMDILMPVMSGLEATRQLRAMPEFTDIPIIALTASVGANAEEKQASAGCTEHLAKPSQTEEVFAVIQKYLAPVQG
ncbi:MAG: PAS domain S-box protein, partial [Gammaproteobacteria bacterium]|nr:PAS domain S-box protein [Gammaproteobacteria bacterium]